MDIIIVGLIAIILSIVVVLFLFIGFFNLIIEPLYIFLFKKPIFIYWYPIPKKLSLSQKLILEKEFPFYRKLSDKKQIYFEHRVKSFIGNYQFVGKDSLSITEEMMIMIAGTYVMLTFGLRHYLVDVFDKIILYPKVYFSTLNQVHHKGEFNARMKVVVFSWEDFKLGHKIENDNIHLGLHEFTHVLHFHCLRSNDTSATVFFDEFNNVVNYYRDELMLSQLIEMNYFRNYAYENQFEFLSVALEHYFSTPEEFKNKHPELFHNITAMLNH